MSSFLTFALDESDALVHVDDVAKGNNCKCHCPHCGASLCAKNAGQWREHHFAHAHGYECEGAYESQLHLLAKEVLQETGLVMLPPSKNGSFPTGLVQVHNIQVEKWDERYHIKPDIEGMMNNGERLLIEFYVSHKVDYKKRQIIVENHLKCVEIDINYQALNKQELKNFLCSSDADRKWIVSMPPSHIATGGYSNYVRNPMYEKTRDIIKGIFDNGTITIHPYRASFSHQNEAFDLRKYGYDVCEVNTRWRGFKSDLLLYRSREKEKGYLSINIRGRRRSVGFRYPKGLRIIDIVFKAIGTEESTRQRIKSGDLIGDLGMDIVYNGFKE